ncbi:hypothetical protein [Heyndrickxia acidicola]|uniref:Uncharacterized protein n=1 Tax=Heyndrickxia acidicola TaxID=209389 RepID=A0ABU6MAP5_9BACI|nr:hypothetical protein [Heyndrickxia acidicola]MED1201575.1 hypothetical protein [Heyndrickxia acidicola]
MKPRKEVLTNAPIQKNIVIESALNEKKPFPGDSVDGHKELEEVNHFITGEEIKQQNNNL